MVFKNILVMSYGFKNKLTTGPHRILVFLLKDYAPNLPLPRCIIFNVSFKSVTFLEI